jgi:hypothetical protein
MTESMGDHGPRLRNLAPSDLMIARTGVACRRLRFQEGRRGPAGVDDPDIYFSA